MVSGPYRSRLARCWRSVVGAINVVNVGYKLQIKADPTEVVTLSDAFNGQRYERFESTPTFTG